MRKEFLDLYDRELTNLRERAEAFALEFPGLADRLGGLSQDRIDPGLEGLLEGAAFLAARVQQKLQREFPEITGALLQRLMPGYLAPLPSAALLFARPDYTRPELARGVTYASGSILDSAYRTRDSRVVCRFRLSSPLQLWPIEIETATYAPGVSALQALGLDVLDGTVETLRLRVVRRTSATEPDMSAEVPQGAKPISELASSGFDKLRVQLVGTLSDTNALYEQLFGSCHRITIRWLNKRGNPIFARLPLAALCQVGFEDDDCFVPEETGMFAGYALLRDFAILPQKFMGFSLCGLSAALGGADAPAFDVLFEFRRKSPRLAQILGPHNFLLHCAPVINLFEERCARVKVEPSHHEHLLLAQSSPHENYEIYRIQSVNAHYGGRRRPATVWPIYGAPSGNQKPSDALFYTTRSRERRLSATELRRGRQGEYIGTETWISLHEPQDMDSEDRVVSLQASALCTNRHLPEFLPSDPEQIDVRLVDNKELALHFVAAPTKPKLPLSEYEPEGAQAGGSGARLWRLVNLLSFGLTGLTNSHGGEAAAALREVLSLFADFSEAVTERQLQGIRAVSLRPIMRAIHHPDGYTPTRGVEVTITLDERSFEGAGFALLGAVIDRFLAESVQVNSFTETVIRTQSSGEVLRWPARSGTGPLL